MENKLSFRIILFALGLLVLSGLSDNLILAQQDMSLKQKLEQGIVENQTFKEQKFLISVQEPVDDKVRMIDFNWQLIDWPFIIKYPANWYIRESYLETSSLFISQEPIKEINDQFDVGMSLYYYPNYFAVQRTLPVSELGKIAYQPVYLNNWDDFKQENIAQIKQQAQSGVFVKEISVGGKAGLRIEFKLNKQQIRCFYVKSGNDLIQIAYQAPIKQFNQFSTVFNLMIESFYFK